MIAAILEQLEARRRELRMPTAILARRSKVSLRTVYRTLLERDPSTSFEVIEKIASALKLRLMTKQEMTAEAFMLRRARWKAKKLAASTQATSALEGQAVKPSEQRKLERLLVNKLLAGSPAELWR